MASSKLSFEALPLDICTEILDSLDTIQDLYSLISASPTCFSLFKLFPHILRNTAKRVVGGNDAAWKAATVVMIHQRHCHGGFINYPAVENDLETPFVLLRTDVVNLIRNQKFMRARFDRSATLLPHTHNHSFQLPLTNHLSTEPASVQTFYELWSYALCFSFQHIDKFRMLPGPTEQQILAFQDLSRFLLVGSGSYYWPQPPTWIWSVVIGFKMRTKDCPYTTASLLQQKLVEIFLDALSTSDQFPNGHYLNSGRPIEEILREFRNDVVRHMEIENLIEKYGLSTNPLYFC
ncbi:hypothetical protein Q9L58_009061 [Maublancomyces gigas]|uniref:F-box domain-containing protein n=1 Tax=Discina gigas TaxID=1032678 RepID=A0ABR3G875_9PEZI